MKMPNGYGQIVKLSGKRRNPYAVYPPVTRYNAETGTPIREKAIGYYATKKDALEALVNWHNCPTYERDATFEDVYNAWSKDKFKENITDGSKSSYEWAFKAFTPLHKKVFSKLKRADFQDLIDNSHYGHSSVGTLIMTLKQIGKFALENDYVVKDYTQFVKSHKKNNIQKGIPFTEAQVKTFWDCLGRERGADIILILIYSGLRISELKVVEIDLERGIMIGGVKNDTSRDRITPIHPAVYELVKNFDQKKFNVASWRMNVFNILLEKLGFRYVEGTDIKHTPHDCRHTFSWLADKYGIDKMSKHLIMGHAMKDVEDSVYGHRTIEELKEQMNKIEVCC